MRTSRVFGERELSDFLEASKSNVLSSIESLKDDYILNVNESDYIAHKLSEAVIEQLEIHEEQIYASSSERMIPAEHFPSSFHVYSGKSYKKDVIKFHVPISGNIQLLYCVPSTRLMWTMNIEVNKNEFCFEIINFSNDPESIVRVKDSNLKSIMQQLAHVQRDVERFNSSFEAQIKSAFESKKSRVKEKSGCNPPVN
jgi:hypothetical protein